MSLKKVAVIDIFECSGATEETEAGYLMMAYGIDLSIGQRGEQSSGRVVSDELRLMEIDK